MNEVYKVLFNFIRDVCLDTHKAGIQRKIDQYKLLVQSGVDEKSDKMVELQIELAGSVADFNAFWS
jgi:hypothetical protein